MHHFWCYHVGYAVIVLLYTAECFDQVVFEQKGELCIL